MNFNQKQDQDIIRRRLERSKKTSLQLSPLLVSSWWSQITGQTSSKLLEQTSSELPEQKKTEEVGDVKGQNGDVQTSYQYPLPVRGIPYYA